MKLNLKTKIILITMMILSLTIGAGTFVSGYIFSDVYGRASKSRASVIGEFLASQIERLLALGIPLNELVGFEVQCQEIVNKHEMISYAMVVDPAGKILFHNDPSQYGKTRPLARLKATKDSKEAGVVFSEGGERYYESRIPIFINQDRHVGDIIIGFPEKIVSKETRRLVVYYAGVAFISFGIAVFLLVSALSSWISNPLVQLLEAIHEVANKGGDFSGKVAVASGDEIGELATAFNRMTEKLRQTTVSRDYAEAISKERERLVQDLQKALGEVKQLSGLLPICASCKKVRDDKGYWRQIESYIRERSEANFTHSICPECEKRLYPDFYQEDL